MQVLIFSTMTRALDIIEEYLDWAGLDSLRLDGSTAAAERGALVQAFNALDSSIPIFLLSVRAGGMGLNLQKADTVIMYDTGKHTPSFQMALLVVLQLHDLLQVSICSHDLLRLTRDSSMLANILTSRVTPSCKRIVADDCVQSFHQARACNADWNPQIDLQAQARVHRIGQTRQVKLHGL